MNFPQALTSYFQNLETIPLTVLSERVVYSNLATFIDREKISLTEEVRAELTAFEFVENAVGTPSVWGTYFHPLIYSEQGGNVHQVPDIEALTGEVLSYWRMRGEQVTHPILKARYIGLYCEFIKKVSGQSPDFMAIGIWVSSLIDSVEQQLNGAAVVDKGKLRKAVSLARQYNLQPQIQRVKTWSLAYDLSIPVDELKNIWSFSFDLLLSQKPFLTTAEEEKAIITLLEARLAAVKLLEPWTTKALVKKLAGYYYKKDLKAEVKRVLYLLKESFEQHISKVPAIQATGHLQELMQLFRLFQLNAEAEQLLIKIRELSKETHSELKRIGVEQELKKDELTAYANQVLKYDGDVMFARIVAAHIVPISEIESNVEKAFQRAPVSFLVTRNIVDRKGRVLANIRPYLEHKEDHQVAYFYNSMQIASIYLHYIFKVGIESSKLSETTVMDFLKRSCIIEQERYGLIEMGIKNFFEGNYMGCIHILIPQFEESIRNLLEINGGNVLTFSDSTFQLKTFNHVLEDEIVIKALGEDYVHYFKVLFTDSRGWNLRNQVAHGLLEPGHFNQQTAERLLHAFFCLGMIRWQDAPPISVEPD